MADYESREDNTSSNKPSGPAAQAASTESVKSPWFEIHPVVFPFAAGVILLFVTWGLIDSAGVGEVFDQFKGWIATHFGWLYVLSLTGILAFCLWLGFGPYGRVKLGPDNEGPEFSTLTWFSMLFSAGMGIGLLFWSVAEPIYHFKDTTGGALGSVTPETSAAAMRAMGVTIFHWGLHPWALYALVALALAYFGFRRGLPLSFRSVFYPLIGERIHGWPGHLIDILAIVATLFGVATSLGLGAQQVNAGLNFLMGVPQSTGIQVALIAGITFLATISVATGLHVGIRRLSELNIVLAGLLMLFVFLAGPTVFLLNAVIENTGAYLQRLPEYSFRTGATDDGVNMWLGWWTVFYWGWWIAWSPFVGMFIARVSKGRTIRQFITGVLLVPTGVSIIWLTVFGSTALHQSLVRAEAQVAMTSAAQADDTGMVVEVVEGAEAQADEPAQPADAADGPYIFQEYPVLVVDDETGLPVAESGALVGPAGNVIMLRDGTYFTRGGIEVVIQDGQVIDPSSDGEPLPAPDEPFAGRFAAELQALSPAEYLGASVLNADQTDEIDKTATAMFVMLAGLPLAGLSALIATICIVLFFVTSSDSASMVIDIIASGGNQDPPLGTRLFWAITEGVIGAVLLLAGGLVALQTASITAALPFAVVILLMCVSVAIGLGREARGDIPQEQIDYAKYGDAGKPPRRSKTETGKDTPHDFAVDSV